MKIKDVKFRLLKEADMPEVSSWFVKHKWPISPGPEILPDTAYIAEIDGVPLAVSWIYLTNSTIFWLEWVATNPNYKVKSIISLKKLSKALLELIPQRHRIEDYGMKAFILHLADEVEQGLVSKDLYVQSLQSMQRLAQKLGQKEPQYRVGHMATPNAKLANVFEKMKWDNTEVAHLLWYHINKKVS